ncbi:hypothetical protein GCK72_021593 [Caenorhabditis remanei]|uniref:Uncharacterized protein n=1 Tax=Caenorhabditis remanei TaxID=31234 RepID=A0A6A5GK95_CAERE|nr:hypothetical protein GCK72_021593 [Caenorhabditis remanei]KAF1755026.1 hypothetical protein GCK72_021593 [Caenorhabditis remanei]
MSRHSKNNSHIWDHMMYQPTIRRNPYYLNTCHDTTGSSISLVEYSRQEITVVSPRIKCPVKPRRIEKPRDAYVTNREREQAEPPKQLAAWKFSPVRKVMVCWHGKCVKARETRQGTRNAPTSFYLQYNPHDVSNAFEAYQHRLLVKKWAEPKRTHTHHAHTHHRTTHKKQVTINETATEIIEDKCPKYQKFSLTNQRNDEVQIDKYTSAKVVSEVSEDVEKHDDVVRIQKPRKPGFYGTIEAELSAEQAATHLSYACENLERLQFVTDAVYPQASDHLKNLREIEDDVKDFGCQMRRRRVKVPTSAGTATQVAHFIINDN